MDKKELDTIQLNKLKEAEELYKRFSEMPDYNVNKTILPVLDNDLENIKTAHLSNSTDLFICL
jgi:hypothetical protein